jgi:FkbM family methyltransferase
VKKTILKLIRSFGYDLKRIPVKPAREAPPLKADTPMTTGLKRSRQRGVTARTIIDIGAAEGKWTEEARMVWREGHFVLFEPLRERAPLLDAMAAQYANTHIVKAGAGREKATIDFFVTGDLDGSGVADNGTNAEKRRVSITTVDAEIARLGLQGPYLLKLDTHGYEVPIFEGATRVLQETELIVVECYGFQIAPGSLLFWEMCQYLDGKGFRLVDLVDVYSRPADNAFWQCDAFFIPKNHPLFTNNTYH